MTRVAPMTWTMRQALAQAVRNERTRAGLTQAEMAKRMDVGHQTIWRWEAGRKDGRQSLLRCWRGGDPSTAKMAGRILTAALCGEEEKHG